MDALRLAVVAIDDGEFAVQVHVNEVEVTSRGAGLGMDPYDLLVPHNLLDAIDGTEVGLARCGCGDDGCRRTGVVVSRDRHLVRWDWRGDVPMQEPATFDAGEYAQELHRAATEHGWETPERRAGRLVLTQLDRAVLASYGLEPRGRPHDDAEGRFLTVPLAYRSGVYHVFVHVAWDGRDPEEVAAELCRRLLTTPPHEWSATWWAPGRSAPPAIARGRWLREPRPVGAGGRG